MARPLLCLLAVTLSRAILLDDDHVDLIQQSLQKVSLAEESEHEQGMLGVLGSVVNMLKLDNLLRERILSIDPDAMAEDSPAQELRAKQSHEAQLMRVPAEAPAEPPAPKESSLAGTGCSLDDHSRMNTSISNLGRLVLEQGPTALQYSLPSKCSHVFGLGVNFTAFDGCIQELFQVPASCSACQVNLLKGLVGTNIFHLGCTPKCASIVAKCQGSTMQSPTQECMSAVGECMDCGLPSWKEHTKCVGGLPNRQQGLQVLDGLVMALKTGSITEPDTLKTILQRAAEVGVP